MRLPPALRRYADRVDAMSLRERVLIFVAVAVVLVAIADRAFFEPILHRQKVNSQGIQQQQDEIRAMQAQLQAYAQARVTDGASAKRQLFKRRKSELAALDRKLAASQHELVAPEQMGKMLSEIVKRNPSVDLVSLRKLGPAAVSSAAAPDSASEGSVLFRHGIEVTVSGSYLNMLGYVSQIERLSAKIVWGSMELQAVTYPKVALKITFYTVSPEKTWLLI